MPKKKTGQRKKAEKCKERQRLIRTQRLSVDLSKHPANELMECTNCGHKQKIRAFCYFCHTVPRLPQCCNCGKQKCCAQTGDCLVKHKAVNATGLQLVGAICDFCEAWVCHSAVCIANHCCQCPMRDATCIECDRTWLEHGGRIFRCAYCDRTLCEDDQFEHQASCQRLEAESFKCPSCNRIGTSTCLRCKLTFCDDHSKRKGVQYERGKPIPCPKCGHNLTDSYALSVSTRSYGYGKQTCRDDQSDTEEWNYPGGSRWEQSSDDDDDSESAGSSQDSGVEQTTTELGKLTTADS